MKIKINHKIAMINNYNKRKNKNKFNKQNKIIIMKNGIQFIIIQYTFNNKKL